MPGDYVLKIESFSEFCKILKESKADKFEFEEFGAGGYEWKLELYPSGDAKMNGNGYISLYLAIADINAIPPRSCVNVMFRLFVHDQIRDKYLTVQEGKMARYHALKTKHGFPQLLPLATFEDSSNGHLFDDCCTFGAEVRVIKPGIKRQKLSIVKKPEGGTYTWKLEKFSTLGEEEYYSDVFTA